MQLFQIEERKISDIIIEDRTRVVLGDIDSLATSIDMIGQLHPILIDTNNKLIDGLRRITAMKQLGKETIEIRVVDEITKDDSFLIELLSNMDRKEFTWYEDIELKYKLHNHWKETAEANNATWGYRDTAKSLRCSLGGLSTDLAFAEALKVFPVLKEQTTKARAKELYKALGAKADAIQRMKTLSPEEKDRLAALQSGNITIPKKNTIAQETKQKNIQLVDELEDMEETQNDDAPISSKINVIYVSENYKTFLEKIPANSVGMVELDPPYAIDFNENYGKTSKIQSKAEDWTEKQLYEFYFNYLPVIYEKLLNDSWVLCWTGKEHFFETNKIAQSIGFQTQAPGAWIKVGGSTNQPKRNMVSNWEMFLLFRKGNAQFNTPSLPSAINISTVSASNRIHQWEKPIALYDHFIKAMGKPGSIFLSPFAGSGNCLISAAKARMMPIGCDKVQKYIPEFYARLENYMNMSEEIEGL